MDICTSQQLYKACFSQVNAELPSNGAQSYVLWVRKSIFHSDGLMLDRLMLLMFLELIVCVFLRHSYLQCVLLGCSWFWRIVSLLSGPKHDREDQYKIEFAASFRHVSVSLKYARLAIL